MKNLGLLVAILIVAGTSFNAKAQSEPVIYKDNDQVKLVKYYENGVVSERGQFVNGKADGKWEQFGEDGRLKMKAHYQEGSKEGNWFVWSDDGESLVEMVYQNNRLQESHLWKIDQRNLLASD